MQKGRHEAGVEMKKGGMKKGRDKGGDEKRRGWGRVLMNNVYGWWRVGMRKGWGWRRGIDVNRVGMKKGYWWIKGGYKEGVGMKKSSDKQGLWTMMEGLDEEGVGWRRV
jgi:hypothetical protein